MRLRKIKNAREKLEQLSDVMIFHPEEYKGKWHAFFQNSNPIYIEIGMGKGKFLIEHAKNHPNCNFIGLEVAESVILKAAQKANESGLKNLYFLNVDASHLRDYFREGEIEKIFLNFSDPWPKSRHAKRRLTYRTFLKMYQTLLGKDGIIEFKTDNRKLFEFSIVEFNQANFLFEEFSLDLHAPVLDEYGREVESKIITTEYEEKFKSLGQVIYYIKVKVNKHGYETI